MNDLLEKNLRDKKIVDMHNTGVTVKEIMKSTGMSKSGVYKVLDSIIKKGELAPSSRVKEVKLTGNEERFSSFVGWERINVNEYSHKDTGEVVRVVFVKATKEGEFGYFARYVGNGEKKSNPADIVDVDGVDGGI